MHKVLLGMSGGIDSSVSALRLKRKGYEVIGLTLKTWTNYKTPEKTLSNAGEYIEKAKNLARRLQIEHHVLDLTDTFQKEVIDNFVDEYFAGRTPNPCVICNRKIKFKFFLKKAKELGCDFVATGHYANVINKNGRYFIRKALDPDKDQSYFLWKLSQDQLSKIIFPLGEEYKKNIIVNHSNFDVAKESFEVCFIPDNNYRNLLLTSGREVGPGNFILNDKVVGQHKGFYFYTIGQRSGLGIAMGYPVFVKAIDARNNIVYLGREEDLFVDKFQVGDVNIMKFESLDAQGVECDVKIRYRGHSHRCTIFQDGDKINVVLANKVKAVTSGQSAVFYDGDDVICGGIIL